MKHHFKCTLLSPVVLSSRAATEGQIDSLDYIPGAKFMGIVAKDYKEFDQTAQHDLFHNGKVRFSNAYPQVACPQVVDEQFLPIPLTYFAKKGDKVTDNTVFLDYLLSEAQRKELSDKSVQLKQQRSGFINITGEQYLTLETDYQLKSAYDAAKRKSKDSQMYGYFSIPKGAVFTFSVEDRTGKYADQLAEVLKGEHGVGRSRTAEYGRVLIEPAAAPPPVPTATVANSPTLIYAASDLCLLDEFGQAKRPEAKDFGFDGEIDWAQTQVQSKVYQSWNTQRWNRDADRWVVKKGAVFCLKAGAKQLTALSWVGSYHQEGFGQIIINPAFLQATDDAYQRSPLKKVEISPAAVPLTEQASKVGDHGLLGLLDRRVAAASGESELYRWVNDFIKNHKKFYQGISSSQWGTLRNYAKHAATYEVLENMVFEKNIGFLYRGQSEKVWRSCREDLETRIKTITVKDDRPIYLNKLAAEMAKRAKNQKA